MTAPPAPRDAVYPVGIVGVGNMGGAMAANLLARGWTVHVHDLDASKTRNLEPFGAIPSASGPQLAIKSEAVIVCVVDAFDAMTTNRAYRASRTPQAAMEELERCVGTHFDPDVVGAFLAAFPDPSQLPLTV